MIFKRKIYDELLQWKKRDGASALLIEGARHVGKSTVVKEFAQKEYESYVYIDFSADYGVYKELLENYMYNLDILFMHMRIIRNDPLPERKTLIIFDEVQNYPFARACIKHLVEDGRYDYIETGSLISIKENVENILIPSEEHAVKMYPLDFEEFCWTLGEMPILSYIHSCFDRRKPMSEGLHRRAMDLFKEYILVGGMPQCVEAYISGGKDLSRVETAKDKILKDYRADILRASTRYRTKVLCVYDNLPSLLSSKDKKIVYNKMYKGAYAGDYEDAFFWLADSMICNISVSCGNPEIGLIVNTDRKCVKCYLGDTGLLLTRFADNAEKLHETYTRVISDDFSADCGILYENAIAQMLVASGHKLFHYSRYNHDMHKKDIEADFLIKDRTNLENKLIPIAVKSSSKYKTTLLKRFKDVYKVTTSQCIVIHPDDLRIEDDTLYLPPYMTFCL
ncbi:MAG: AAA family ATPase [Clostridia bacterium]|nr:AAA family ATPase [Clostridia bacterium]